MATTAKPVDLIGMGWDSYSAEVLPSNAGEIRRIECRRAFYAGAWKMFLILTMMGEPDVPEEAAMVMLEAIKHEIETFVRGGGT